MEEESDSDQTPIEEQVIEQVEVSEEETEPISATVLDKSRLPSEEIEEQTASSATPKERQEVFFTGQIPVTKKDQPEPPSPPKDTEETLYPKIIPATIRPQPKSTTEPKNAQEESYVKQKPATIKPKLELTREPKNAQEESYAKQKPATIKPQPELITEPKNEESYAKQKPATIKPQPELITEPKNEESYAKQKPATIKPQPELTIEQKNAQEESYVRQEPVSTKGQPESTTTPEDAPEGSNARKRSSTKTMEDFSPIMMDEGDDIDKEVSIRKRLKLLEESEGKSKFVTIRQNIIVNARSRKEKKTSLMTKMFRKIEAEHGSGVHFVISYLLNSLVLSVLLSTIVFVFLLIPYGMVIDGRSEFTLLDIPICQSSVNTTGEKTKGINLQRTATKISGLFYGTFIIDSIAGKYNFPTAYAAVFATSILIVLFFLLYRGSSIDARRLTTRQEYCISDLVFAGYDFSITDEECATLNINKTVTLFKIFAKHIIKEQQIKKISRLNKIICRTIVTLYSITFYGITGLAIYYSLKYTDKLKQMTTKYHSFINLITSTVMILLKLVFIKCLEVMIKVELYTPSTELFVYVIRLMIFYMISIFLLLYKNFRSTIDPSCWESRVGMHLLMYIITGFILESLFMYLSMIRSNLVGIFFTRKSEYKIAPMVLSIFADQIMSWIGMFFSPWINVVLAIKHSVAIFSTPLLLKKYYEVPLEFYNIYTLKSLLDICLWIFYIYQVAILGIMLSSIPASPCGPFSIKACDKKTYLIDQIMTIFSQAENFGFLSRYVVSSCFIFLIIALLCLAISALLKTSRYYKLSYDNNEKYFRYLSEENKELTKKLLIYSKS